MLLLTLFALIAGAGTAVSPCVLPILPALLSAGALGGHRRPLGIVLGLALTFTVSVVGFASAIGSAGLGHSTLRLLAISVLLLVGVMLLVPALAARIEAPLSRLARFGPKTRGEGFWSGLAVGGALGFVYLPCAGPILGAVIAVSARQGASLKVLILGLAYALGSAIVLLALTLGGRRVLDRVRRAGRGPNLQRAVGVVLLATGALMLTNVDNSLRVALAGTFLGNPTQGLEDTAAIRSRLQSLSGKPRFDSGTASAATRSAPQSATASIAASTAAIPGVQTPDLPQLGPAPEFVDTQRWFNTPGAQPLTLASLRGRVVLIDFWTYTCINCLRTLPYLKAWDQRYRDSGLTIVGVHTPEFDFEHDAGNVASAISSDGIRYPVVQDNNYATWSAWGNQYWPAEYLIDANGVVRHTHFGEGEYAQGEAAIRALLAESGRSSLPQPVHAAEHVPSSQVATPETYVDAVRGQGWLESLSAGARTYAGPGSGGLAPNEFALGGSWNVHHDGSTAGSNASIDVQFQAQRVYLVLSPSAGGANSLDVRLDGKPLGAGTAGADVHGSRVSVTSQRLYNLVSLPAVAQHRLTLRLAPGLTAFSFTFG
jgi:cytochrome c biogenesis protein CcdA/thiol-disulfide isomerase/thioredoxin